MTPAELNALNSLIASKVMGWTQAGPAFKSGEFHIVHDGSVLISTDGGKMQFFNPAESPADAMAVLKVIAQKLGHLPEIRPSRVGWAWIVRHEAGNVPTLETAICLFAVKLFQ